MIKTICIFFFYIIMILETRSSSFRKPMVILNEKPIIGVLTQPLVNKQFGSQYIMASYVKFVEMGGARVVPILYDMELDKQTELYNQLNGIFLPGGDVDFKSEHQYNNTLHHIWNYVIETNKNGDYFPLWGTCLGFEEIVSVAVNSYDVLGNFPISKVSLPMQFTKQVNIGSRLFGGLSLNEKKIYETENINWHNHQYGISIDTFEKVGLTKLFNILALNKDSNGNTFISAIEGIKPNLPVYAVMHHPEKVFFSWVNDGTNHSKNSIIANQHYSIFFVNECKKSSHSFKDKEEEINSLIYNYNPIYTIKYYPVEQIYFFNSSKP